MSGERGPATGEARRSLPRAPECRDHDGVRAALPRRDSKAAGPRHLPQGSAQAFVLRLLPLRSADVAVAGVRGRLAWSATGPGPAFLNRLSAAILPARFFTEPTPGATPTIPPASR